MKVIVTRPSPDAELFARDVARIGAAPVLSPVMAIRARDMMIDLEDVTALAFTSANGVRIFAALSPSRDLQVFAVGATTAMEARKFGFSDVAAAQGDVESLAMLISETKQPGAILHLAGSERAGDLVRLLAAKGSGARRDVIYDAVEIEDLSTKAAAIFADPTEMPAIVFFSPRSARLFLGQVQRAGLSERLRDAAALCLSGEVAAAICEARWSAVRVARARTAEAMLRLVEDTLAERKGRIAAPR